MGVRVVINEPNDVETMLASLQDRNYYVLIQDMEAIDLDRIRVTVRGVTYELGPEDTRRFCVALGIPVETIWRNESP